MSLPITIPSHTTAPPPPQHPDLANTTVSEAYIETSSNSTTTQITSGPGGSTYFQPVVGSQTGSVVRPSGANASGASGASGAGSSASGSAVSGGAAAASSRAAGYMSASAGKGWIGVVVGLVGVAVGMMVVA